MALDPSIKAVGFDMDGTFMKTRIDYVRLSSVVVDTYTKYGVPADVLMADGYKLTMDNCDRWLNEHGLKAHRHEIDLEIQEKATEIEMENASASEVFPGAADLIGLLKSKGYKVGILTRGGRRYAEYILGKAGLLSEFDALVARDDYPETEAKPSAKAMEHFAERLGVGCGEILYVGDGLVDYLTCLNSGARFIGVCTGHENVSENIWRKKVGADATIIPGIADLIPMLRRFGTASEELVVGQVPEDDIGTGTETFRLPELPLRVLPENERVHGTGALVPQDLL